MLSEDRLKRIEATLLADVEFLRRVARQAVAVGDFTFHDEDGDICDISSFGGMTTTRRSPELGTYLRNSKETSVEGGE
jgi:hypothetical protein